MRKFAACAFGAILLFWTAGGLSACGSVPRTSYTISGEYFPDENKLVCEMEAMIANPTENAFPELSFELWANAYREGAHYPAVSELQAPSAYYAGRSYGGIEVLSVEGAQSFRVSGEDENILSVALEEPLYPGETAALTFSFEVTLAEADHRLGVGEHTVNLAHFYPVLCTFARGGFGEYVSSPYGDPFVSGCADYDVTLVFPEEFGAAYAGEGEISVREGKKTLHALSRNVRDVAFVLGRGMKCLTGQAGKVPVEYWYFSDDPPETAFAAAKDSLSYFSETFGEYAYPRYVVAETDLPFGGMEYPGLAMVSADLKEDKAAAVAHETAHQWWYASVGSDQYLHAWQDEGLAEYSAALFFGAFPAYGGSYEEFVSRCERSYRTYFSVSSQIVSDTAMDRPLGSFGGEYEYRSIVYDKGVVLFDRVRGVAGERKFFAGLRKYASEYAGKIAAPEDLIACFLKAGANVGELFRSFTEGRCVI